MNYLGRHLDVKATEEDERQSKTFTSAEPSVVEAFSAAKPCFGAPR